MRTHLTILLGLTASLAAQNGAATLQTEANRQFEELKTRLERLAALQRGTQEGPTLEAANAFLQARKIGDRMVAIRGLLERSQFDQALTDIKSVQGDLIALLDILLGRERAVEDLVAEIDRLEAYKKRVKELRQQQDAQEEASRRSAALIEQIQAIEKAKSEIEDIQREQAELRGRTKADDAEKNAASEDDLDQRVRDLTPKLRQIEKRGKQLGSKGGKRESEPKEGQDSEGAKPGESKPGESKPGEKPTKPSESGKPSETKPNEQKPTESEPKDGPPSEPSESKGGGSCNGSAQKASKAMQDASSKLSLPSPKVLESKKAMQEAEKALDEALERLEALQEEARRKLMQLPFDQQAKAQENTRLETDKLAQEMEEDERKASEQGKPKGTPGRQNVQQAIPKQKSAAGSLKEKAPRKANQEQDDAAEELAEAERQLEEALQQLREQLQDEILRALEERFATMLTAQRELSERTRAAAQLAANAGGPLPEGLVDRARAIADEERALGAEAQDALKLIEEEGTSAAFPEIVEILRDDLFGVASRLEVEKPTEAVFGPVTQAAQAEIEATLEDLIDALRQRIQDGEAGKPCQCNGQPVLVPRSAELKLVLIKQRRVNKATSGADNTASGKPVEGEIAAHLSAQQRRVEKLLRGVADKIAQDEAERAGSRR